MNLYEIDFLITKKNIRVTKSTLFVSHLLTYTK